MARVPLMPISQSASERQRAASASGSISSSLRSLVKPSRIAPGVIDCSHRRLTGCLAFAFCAIRRKISSPSRPASHALIRCGDVLALDQAVQHLQARLGLGDRVQREVRRNHRQVGEAPLAALDVVLFRHRDFQQVADGRRQHVLVGLEILIVLGEAAQRLGDVVRDGGLLGDDEGFGHIGFSSYLLVIRLAHHTCSGRSIVHFVSSDIEFVTIE